MVTVRVSFAAPNYDAVRIGADNRVVVNAGVIGSLLAGTTDDCSNSSGVIGGNLASGASTTAAWGAATRIGVTDFEVGAASILLIGGGNMSLVTLVSLFNTTMLRMMFCS